MLSKADNELLVRVGPKTPMGELFRRFWTPVMLATEIGAADEASVPVRVLGEDLVAFRDSHGNLRLRKPPQWPVLKSEAEATS